MDAEGELPMKMKLVVDRDGCTSCGDCVLTAPDVFDLDDDDARVVLLQEHPPESARVAVGQAVRDCPADVIRIVHL
jgi:ferredoxin